MTRSFGARASRSLVTPKTRLYSRSEGMNPACIRSSCSRSTLSASAQRIASSMRWSTVTPSSAMPARQQRRRPADGDLGAHLEESPDVAPRHPAVQDVAADRDLEPLDPAELVAQGEQVEQALGRVLVLPVAGVDDVGLGSARPGTARRPTSRVADDDHVDPHRLEVARGVDQGLALATPTSPATRRSPCRRRAASRRTRTKCGCGWRLRRRG